MDFDTAFSRLLGHEGAYSNNPADPGKETMWGVTASVARSNGYTGSMRDLPQATAKKIYRAQFWDAARCDTLPEAVRFDVFDGCVNSGIAQSIKWLQRAAGVDDDGAFGKVTLAACNAMPSSVLSSRYNGHRLEFMTNLKTWPVFSSGWARRIANNLKAA